LAATALPQLYALGLRLAIGQARQIARQSRLHIRRGIRNQLDQHRSSSSGRGCFLGGVRRRRESDFVRLIARLDRIHRIEHRDVKDRDIANRQQWQWPRRRLHNADGFFIPIDDNIARCRG